MSNITPLRRALAARILDGEGCASHDLRRAAFDNTGLAEPLRTLLDKVAMRAHTITDDDVAEARTAGLSEDQIFELAVCAAIGQSTRQYDAAFAALEIVTATVGHAPRDPR
jgi:alkylhydroperoxidase family enzyme